MPHASVQTMRTRHMRVQVRHAWHVLRLLYRRSCLVFVVFKLRCPHLAIVPDLHLCCQRTPSTTSIWVEHIWMCQTVWCTYGLYLWCNYIPLTFLSMIQHTRMYVHIIYVLCENRSSIQSLELMHLAMIIWFDTKSWSSIYCITFKGCTLYRQVGKTKSTQYRHPYQCYLRHPDSNHVGSYEHSKSAYKLCQHIFGHNIMDM